MSHVEGIYFQILKIFFICSPNFASNFSWNISSIKSFFRQMTVTFCIFTVCIKYFFLQKIHQTNIQLDSSDSKSTESLNVYINLAFLYFLSFFLFSLLLTFIFCYNFLRKKRIYCPIHWCIVVLPRFFVATALYSVLLL